MTSPPVEAPVTKAAVLRAASELARVFRDEAVACERARHLSPTVVDAYARSGVVRTLVPRRFGGYELHVETALDILIEMGRGDGSSAWVGGYWLEHAYLVALFADRAQRDVWSDGPDARVATSFAPHGTISPADGGWILDGQWPWCSGVGESNWVIVGAAVTQARFDRFPELRLCLVPSTDFTVIDTWRTAGLTGSGTDDVLLREVFVPEHRTCDLASIREGRSPGSDVNENAMYRVPFVATELYALTGTAIGIARGALEAWVEFASHKIQTYTGEHVSSLVSAQIRIAEIAAEIDAAELLVRQALRRASEQVPVEMATRVRNRRDFTYATRMLVRAIDALLQMGGATGLLETSPVQRGWRDIHAISTHVLMNFEGAGENYGRQALGLPLNPRDPFF